MIIVIPRPTDLTGDTLLTGIRENNNMLYITGFYKTSAETTSFIFTCKSKNGKLKKSDVAAGTLYPLNYYVPGSQVFTSLYGPDVLANGNVRAVGNVSTQSLGSSGPTGPVTVSAVLYEGTLSGVGAWTILEPSAKAFNSPEHPSIAHSTMGGLLVGNYAALDENANVRSNGFVYDIAKNNYSDIVATPTQLSLTAYGIWDNGDGTFTICGGYVDKPEHLGLGYLLNWVPANVTPETNLLEFVYDNADPTVTETHFNGISGGKKGYKLTGDAVTPSGVKAFSTYIKRVCSTGQLNPKPKWNDVKFPCSLTTSGNSIDGDIVIGVYNKVLAGQVSGYLSYEKKKCGC